MLRWNSTSLFAVKEYHCSQTGIIAPDYFSLIETVVGNLLRDNNSAHSIITQLQKQFPILNNIVLSYSPMRTQISLYAHKPLCCINNSLVITGNGELFPKDNFSDDMCSTIPSVAVAPHYLNHAVSHLLSLLHALPSDFDQHYNLRLESEHTIRLTDKDKPQFSIVSSAAQKNMAALLSQCNLVKKNLDARKKFDKNSQWAADTRFADYIIAYRA